MVVFQLLTKNLFLQKICTNAVAVVFFDKNQIFSYEKADFICSACGHDWCLQRRKGRCRPQGEKGNTGAQGVAGPGSARHPGGNSPQGPQGVPGVQPLVYDFNLDVSKTLSSYSWPTKLNDYDVVFVYLKKSSSFYTLLPFDGFAYTSDQKSFLKVNLDYDFSTFTLYINSNGTVPTGATFLFRAVVIRAQRGVSLILSVTKTTKT